MAQPLCPPLSESWIHSADWDAARPPPPSDRDCGCTPASSPDSWGSAAASSPVPSPVQPGTLRVPRALAAGRRGVRGSRMGGGQRQSASEREKLRMRTLARALHELRRFLPPSVAPAGQNLTKIETLRLAIRYIGHLSAVLGLSEESLQRRRPLRADAASSPGCPLCPDGDPAQVQVQVRGPDLGSDTRAGARWEFPAARTTPELRNPPALYAETTCPQGPVMEPSPSSPLFPSDVLALLETWIPLSPPEWPPV